MIPALSRSQLRRAQRKHTAACYKAGALFRASHRKEVDIHNAIISSGEVNVLVESLAAHRCDADTLGYEVHYAATANCLAKSAGNKSQRVFNEHRCLHQHANAIKHQQQQQQAGTSPPPPPPLFRTCEDLEKVLVMMPAEESFQPFSGVSWNLNAEVFVPGIPAEPSKPALLESACYADWESLIFTVNESILIKPFNWKAEPWIPGLSVYRGPDRIAEFEVDIGIDNFETDYRAFVASFYKDDILPLQPQFLMDSELPELPDYSTGTGIAMACSQDTSSGECKVQ
jgi:hypothetical protein